MPIRRVEGRPPATCSLKRGPPLKVQSEERSANTKRARRASASKSDRRSPPPRPSLFGTDVLRYSGRVQSPRRSAGGGRTASDAADESASGCPAHQVAARTVFDLRIGRHVGGDDREPPATLERPRFFRTGRLYRGPAGSASELQQQSAAIARSPTSPEDSWNDQGYRPPPCRAVRRAYSVLASWRIGTSGSASFHDSRKSSYALRAFARSPLRTYARPCCKQASG